MNAITRHSRRTSHRVITASVLFSVLICAALLIIQAVKGPTVLGCFFPTTGVLSGVFYLCTTRRRP